jgi:hypothetical protein
VLFTPLTQYEIGKVLELMFDDLRTRLAARRLTLEVTEEVRRFTPGRDATRCTEPGRYAGTSPGKSRPASGVPCSPGMSAAGHTCGATSTVARRA